MNETFTRFSKAWRPPRFKKQSTGKLMQRKSGFRDRGIKTCSFEYINKNKGK